MSQATIYANPTLFFFITENTGSTETATSKDDSTQFKLIILPLRGLAWVHVSSCVALTEV